ncbi:MerR family transcriptional regulator [Pseudothauera rhizosphaerae]|uniref:Mercuric resistance operon regulatory protein n=1 Tax=Pseudothauera rhizosphaerae TaxID=2565932 RepID=A0A4S4B0I2_9RHOO|nr:MerR family DNA-binding protein [Pseudothauera rhizosphaerae]THF64375.1 MerR family transcriptional regulator [Pseudothauera rhizosphaerae]
MGNSSSPSAALTIGRLASAAGVGVETVRYYQRRGLIGAPAARRGAFRVYDADALSRLHFIRRAQTLGFSLDEIAELLALDEERDRDKARAFAQAKIADIESRIHRLEEVRAALQGLVHCCEHTAAPAPCPILQAFGSDT